MKLLCLNVALFEANNHLLSQFLKEQQSDILCLQEITRALEKSVQKDYVTKDIVDDTTPHLSSFFFWTKLYYGKF